MKFFLFFILCVLLINNSYALKSQGDSFHPKNKLKGLPTKLLNRWETTKQPRQVTTHFAAGNDALRVTPAQYGADPTGQTDSTKALQG